MAFANRGGTVHHALFRRVERPIGLSRLFIDLAGLDEAALRFIVLPRCDAIALALIAWGVILLFWLFGHAKPPSPLLSYVKANEVLEEAVADSRPD